MENLKYFKDIKTCFGTVTFEEFKEADCEAFRYVHEDINDERNFLPVYVLDKERERTTFKGFAISLFETKQAAKNRMLKLTSSKRKIFKKLGTHIASGGIEKKCGLRSEANKDKHFDLFEYENVDLRPYFEIVEKIA